MYKSEQNVLLMKSCIYAFIYHNIRVGNKSMQFVMKQLLAGAISYSIDMALA